MPNKKIESITATPIENIIVPTFPIKFIKAIAQIAPTAPPPRFSVPLLYASVTALSNSWSIFSLPCAT